MEDVHVILNPVAGGGRAGRDASRLQALLTARLGRGVSLHLTRHPRHAIRLAREAVLGGADLVVAAGGDGTIHEVVNGLFDGRRPLRPECALGIVNFGTGEGFARTLGLPRTLEEQVQQLLDPGHALLDVGWVSYREAAGGSGQRLFVNDCQLGIGAAVVAAVGASRKSLGGRLAFGSATLGKALTARAAELTVRIDEAPPASGRFLGVAIENGCSMAGGMRLTPDARPDDGLFDILFIHQMSLLQRLLNFPRLYAGSHLRSPFFSLRRGKDLSIEAAEEADLEADGELLGKAPCRVLLLPGQLRVKARLPSRGSGHEQLASEDPKVRV